MTYSPKSITDVALVWTSNGGVNLGIVGNTAHKAGYHLGKDRIYDGSGPGGGAADYSVKLQRDIAGLTNAASALDLGRLDGTLAGLQKFSSWLVAQCKANAPGTKDVREVIFSPDGRLVKRWDNNVKVLYAGGTGTGQGDNSHLTHTHISFFRDSESRDKTILFKPYFGTATTTEEITLPSFKTFATPQLVAVPTNDWIYVKPDLSPDPLNIQINPGRDLPVAGKLADGTLIIGYRDTTPIETEVPTYYFRGTPKGYPVVSPTVVPVTAESCKTFSDAASAAGYNSGKIAGHQSGTAIGVINGIANEQARMKGVLGLR